MFKKGLIIEIIVLFIGVAVIPSINANISKENVDYKIPDHNYDNPESDVKPLLWWDRWPDLPGRYKPMFDVYDIVDLGHAAWGLTSADFNDDGELDFAVSYSPESFTSSRINISYNNGEMGFNQEEVFRTDRINDLDSSDYDNDGDIDLMFTQSDYLGDYSGFVYLLLNDGNNNFTNYIRVAHNLPIDERKRINPQITSDDFDNDSDIDFLVGDQSGLVTFFKNDGTGNFSKAGEYDFGKEFSWGISSADFDNDGDIDFIVTQSYHSVGYICLVWNDGTSSCFNQSNYVKIVDLPLNPTFFVGTFMHGLGCLQCIDYNNDGMMDFIFADGPAVYLFMQKSIGVFDYFHIMRLPAPADKEEGGWLTDDLREGGITTGDFNNDNLDDLVIGGNQGVARICYNNLVLVDIVHPDRTGVSVFNKFTPVDILIYSFLKHGTSIAIGDLTIQVKALEPLQKVEFYLGNKLVHTDDSEPFEWEWNSFSFGRHKVKALGYNMDGNKVGFDDALVWKFF